LILGDHLLKAVLRKDKNGTEQTKDFSKIAVYDDVYTGITVAIGNKIFENGYSSNDLNDGVIRNVDGTVREIWKSVNYNTNKSKGIYQIILKIAAQITELENRKML